MTTASTAKKPGGARVAVQRFGTFLSGMIMPNIAAFIAWGFITMLFIPAGFFGANSPFKWHWAPVAEIIGGAIALNLLLGIPLLTGGVITALVAFALLALQARGYRPFELSIAGLLGVITLGFLYGAVTSGADGSELAAGLVPRFEGT